VSGGVADFNLLYVT